LVSRKWEGKKQFKRVIFFSTFGLKIWEKNFDGKLSEKLAKFASYYFSSDHIRKV